MKQTISFEINPCDDGQETAKMIMHYHDFWSALWEIDQYCRAQIKHGETSEETDDHLERIRDMIREHAPGDMF